MRRMQSADGHEMAVLVEGSGPPVLLLHGFPDRAAIWRHQIDALRSEFTLIAPDLRGLGDSDKPADPDAYRVGRSVADAIALLDALGIERAHVVGHDFGAAVAWALAASAPERVQRLAVLSVGHPSVPMDLDQRRRSWYMLLFQFPEAEELLRRDDWAFLREWAATHPDLERVIADLGRPGALEAGLNWYRGNRHPRRELDPPRVLPTISAPTLGLWSTGDVYLTEARMTGSAAFVEDWRYERIEDAGHWLQLDKPDEVTALIRSHLC
jgi:pimeloyl-ACP methyl ester carboxylesterase